MYFAIYTANILMENGFDYSQKNNVVIERNSYSGLRA